MDVKTVSSMLGHYDAGFTLRTYTHATRQKQDEAAQTMGSFMAQVMQANLKEMSGRIFRPLIFQPFRAFPRVGQGVGQS